MVLSDNQLPRFPFSKIRVLPFKKYSGAVNMALDLFFAGQVAESGVPVFRFYGWEPYCLSLGYHQHVSAVDRERLQNDGFDLVKRPTGGSAIFHSEEITYSLIIPKQAYSHHHLYQMFHQALAQALQKSGFPVNLSTSEKHTSYLNKGSDTFACFNRAARSEIQYDGKKVVGSAQKVYKEAILQHGSILTGARHEHIVSYLKITDEEKAKQWDILQKKALSLSQISDKSIEHEQIMEALLVHLISEAQLKIHYKYPTAGEQKAARAYLPEVCYQNE